jgi:hypothetical protein
MTDEEAFELAVTTYLQEESDGRGGDARRPDQSRSIVILALGVGTVILRDQAGVPLGTVSWSGYGVPLPAFEPPTKLTLVDHFQSLKPSARPINPILIVGEEEFEYELDDEHMRVWRRKDDKRGEFVGTIQIFSGDTFTSTPSLDPFASYVLRGEIEGRHVAHRTETRDGKEVLLVICQCGRATEVPLSSGTRTYKAWRCDGGHWTKVDVSHAATRDPG